MAIKDESQGNLSLNDDINAEIGASTNQSNVSLGDNNAVLFTNVSDGDTTTGRSMSELGGESVSNASTTAWLTGDNVGNLFYTQTDSGLSGWTAGPQLGSARGWFRDAVYNGSGWLAVFDTGVWATTDTSATSGWVQTKSFSTTGIGCMWTGGGWIVNDRYDAYYTTDTIPNGSTTWTTFDLGSVIVAGGLANDGSNSFISSRGSPDFRIKWDLFNALTTPSSRTQHLITGYFGRGAYFVPDGHSTGNDVYLSTTTHPNSFYYTVNSSDWSTATVLTKNIGATASYFDYNGSYYAFADTTNCKITRTSGNLVSGGYSTTTLTSLGIDRMTQIHWNGTSWASGCRSTSGNSNMAIFRNASDPYGTWTAVSTPSGFNGTRTLRVIPSKRPYYNAMTNLGG